MRLCIFKAMLELKAVWHRYCPDKEIDLCGDLFVTVSKLFLLLFYIFDPQAYPELNRYTQWRLQNNLRKNCLSQAQQSLTTHWNITKCLVLLHASTGSHLNCGPPISDITINATSLPTEYVISAPTTYQILQRKGSSPGVPVQAVLLSCTSSFDSIKHQQGQEIIKVIDITSAFIQDNKLLSLPILKPIFQTLTCTKCIVLQSLHLFSHSILPYMP